MAASLQPAEPMTPANQFLGMLELIADGGLDEHEEKGREFLADLMELAVQRLRNPSRQEGAA